MNAEISVVSAINSDMNVIILYCKVFSVVWDSLGMNGLEQVDSRDKCRERNE